MVDFHSEFFLSSNGCHSRVVVVVDIPINFS
jgi:hypothetical protein